MKSKYRAWALLPVSLIFPVSALICLIFYIILVKEKGSIENIPYAVFIFLGLFIFVWTWLVFGELRKRVVSVVINNNSIARMNFVGIGPRRVFDFKDFEGYVTMFAPSKWGTYEYLFLLRQNHKAIVLSEFYHKNYHELKKEISIGVIFLGEKPFTLMEMLKNIY